jgi:hypothetical protein
MDDTDQPNYEPTYHMTFPTLEAAVSALCGKTFAAKLHFHSEAASPAAGPLPVPEGLPPVPEGYVYIGEDNGGIATGCVDPDELVEVIRWLRQADPIPKWRKMRTGNVTGRDRGWHAAAPVGHPLVELNAAAHQPTPPSDDLWQEKIERLTQQRDRYMRSSQNLGKECEELEGRWLEAVADAQDQREEVKRLAALRDKDNADLFAYGEFTRNVATALGGSTHEISFDEVLQRINELHGSETRFQNYWMDACRKIKTLTTERNALHAERGQLKAAAAEARAILT